MEKEKHISSMADQQVGYECEFVEKPPKAVQSECPVCLLVLREPYQATCCGYAFCQVCTQKVKKNGNLCPCCNSETFDTFGDKRLKRSLYELDVKCTNKQQGCQWEGELGQLDNHLNYNPTKDNHLEGCQFSKIKCLYCSDLFLRSDMKTHQIDQCSVRPFSCQYCKDFNSNHLDVTLIHWPVCDYYPVPCPNKCGKTLQRQNLQSHITNDCPLTIIDCDFQHVGCEVRLPRKDIPAHLQESVVRHMSFHALSYKQVVARLEEENKELKQQVVKLTKDLQMYKISTPMRPVEFTVTNFEQKRVDKVKWLSPPFYTHQNGYKLKLCVDACGKHSTTHISVSLILMKGENDNKLKWPFKGTIEIQLLNQDQDEGHYEHIVDFSGSKAGNRVTSREEASFKCGIHEFICHDDLIPNYLKNNCLRFRINNIIL